MRRKRNRKRRTKRRRRVMRGGFPKGTVVRFSPFGISQEGWRFLPRPQATDLNTRRQIAGRLGIYPMAGGKALAGRGHVGRDTRESVYGCALRECARGVQTARLARRGYDRTPPWAQHRYPFSLPGAACLRSPSRRQ